MYAVILAGGGGTRLWPLSRPERPKPFLPLLGDETLLQRTVDRIAPLLRDGDIFCVTDRRYGQLVRDQLPGAGLIVEPNGRNTAAAIALADGRDRPARGRGHARPAGRPLDRATRTSSGASSRRRSDRLANGAFGVEDAARDDGHPARPPRDGVRLPRPRHDALDDRPGRPGLPAIAFEEKPNEHRARELINLPGVAWNAGMFALAARRDPGRDREVHAADDADRAGVHVGARARRGLRPDEPDLDRPRGHGGRGRRPSGPDGRDGRRLERPRQLVGAARGLPAATSRRDRAASSSRARRSRSGPTISWSAGRRALAVEAPTRGYDRGRQRLGASRRGPASRGRRASAPRPRAPARRSARDEHRRSPGPDDDRLRHRRVAGQDRRRLHVRERPALRRRRRPLRRRSRRAGEGRRDRLRPAVRLGVLRGRGRGGPPRPRHPRRVLDRRRADPDVSYEVVERGAAAGIVITASHNPWTDNGFKVKSPSGSAAGPEILQVIEAQIARNGGTRSSAGRSPTPRPRGWSSATTRTRATSATSGGRSTSTP